MQVPRLLGISPASIAYEERRREHHEDSATRDPDNFADRHPDIG